MNDATEHRPAEVITLPARSRPIDTRHALLAAGLCWAGFAAVLLLMLTGRTVGFDHAGLSIWRDADLQPRGSATLADMVRDFTALGGVLLRNLFALGAAAALLFLGLRREAVGLTASVMGGWAVNSLLKIMIARPRPSLVPHLAEVGGHSFPSGHSFNSAAVYIAIGLTFAAISARRGVRATVIGSAIVLSMLVALSRVWLGVHYPSDAIAGWLAGAGWAFLASALLYRR